MKTTKDVRGHSLKEKWVRVLQNGRPNTLRLFKMTEEHETGVNNIVEAMHRFIQDLSRQISLPKTLFVQLYNCTRENKDRYLLGYLETLLV